MAINRPVSKTVISTVGWGIPITDEVNRLAGLVDGNVPTPWTQATLQNGYTHFSGRPVQYRKVGDIVQCRGRASKPMPGSVGWEAIFTFPVGFRIPTSSAASFAIACVLSNAAWQTCVIQTDMNGGVIPSLAQVTDFDFMFQFPTTA